MREHFWMIDFCLFQKNIYFIYLFIFLDVSILFSFLFLENNARQNGYKFALHLIFCS